MYVRQTRSLALNLVRDMMGLSVVYLRSMIRQAWQGGMTYRSVRTSMNESGRGRNGVDGHAAGRKPIHADYEPYAWDMTLYPRVVKFVTKMYCSSPDVTQEQTWDAVRLKYFVERNAASELLRDEKGDVRLLGLGKAPTLRQIRTIIDDIPADLKIKGRKGRANFDNNYKPMIGCVADDCAGPAHTYEIDASQVDHWIVSREEGKQKHIIGKATLYIVVDRFSRLLVGWAVSLDPPSWTGAMQAILSIFQDKEEMCRENGVEYDSSHWPAHGLMAERFFADRGSEMTGHNSEMIIDGLGVKVTNARSLWSAAKGMVECTFKLIHVSLKVMHAGYDPAYNTKTRRARKTYKDARLNLAQLRSKLLQAIIDHNTRVHKGYVLHPNDVRDGVLAIPASIFVRGMARHGRPSTYDEQEVLFHLLPRDKATVHEDGISYGGAKYKCAEAIKKGWHTKAAGGNPFEIDIRHLPGIVDNIYVIDYEDPSVYYLATLTSSCKAFAGMSRAELLNLEQVQKKNDFAGDRLNADMRVQRLDRHTQDGLFEKTTPAVKTKGMGELRAVERYRDRSEQLALPPPGGLTPQPVPTDDSSLEPQLKSAINVGSAVIVLPSFSSSQVSDYSKEASPAEATPASSKTEHQSTRTGLADAARARLVARLKGKPNV